MKSKKIQIPKNQSDSLLNLFFQRYSLYKLPDGKNIAVKDKTNEWIHIQKDVISSILRNIYFNIENQTISKSTINTAYEMIKSIADSCKDKIEIIDILYQSKNEIIFNIYGSDSYIHIEKNHIELCKKSKSDKLFSNMSYTPIYPQINNSDSKNYLSYIQKLFNVENNQCVLFGVYIVTLFIKNINHPLLILSGDYGAAKTTTAKKIVRVLNPYGDLTQLSKNIDDIATILSNNYLIAFDNVSKFAVTRDLADLLCSAVTGSTYQKRRLYTNDEITTLKLHNPIIINGLSLQFPYSDLLDRSIIIPLKRIDDNNRLTDQQVWDDFYNILPYMQGCIFKLISKAMGLYENITLDNTPRLADFSLWGYAIAEALETGLGETFIHQYLENIETASMSAIESNPLLSTIQDLMNDTVCWEGTPTELLIALKNVYYQKNNTDFLPKGFPITANILSRRLRESEVELKKMKLDLTIGRDSNRYINITKTGGNKNE